MEKTFTSKEIMISKNGKPIFAVCISSQGNNANYVYIDNGDIKFSQSWMDSIQPFNVGDESHQIAKEMFTIGIRAAIKLKILDLKQLQSILTDLQLEDCIGTLIQDNTRILLEVKSSIEAIPTKVEIMQAAEQAITSTVLPLAIKKDKRSKSITEDDAK